MKSKLLSILLFCHCIVSAQKTLEGTVYLYQEKGNNLPLADVSIIAPGSSSAVTKQSGSFSFTFDNSIATTSLRVVRIGYEIINEEDIQNVELSKSKKVNIYFDEEGNTEKRKRELVDASLAQLKKTRDNYYNIIEKGGPDADRLKLKLEKESGKKFNNMDEVKAHLFDKYGGDSKTIDRIFTSIIRLNLDHKNKDVEKIKEYTLSGDLASALTLLNFDAAFKEVKKNNNLIDAARENNKAEKEKFLSGIPLFFSNGLFDKVDSAYQLAWLTDTTDMKLLREYAYHLKVQNQVSRAIPLHYQLLRNYSKEGNSAIRAEAMADLGRLLLTNLQADQALSYFQGALSIYDKLSDIKKDTLLLERGSLYAGMAEVLENKDKTASERYMKQCLDFMAHFVAGHSVNLSDAFKDFGTAIERNDARAQIRVLKELIEICRPLVEKSPDSRGIFRAFVATCYRLIGVSLLDLGEREEAKMYFLKSLNAFRKFAEYNPGLYEPEVATALVNMGVVTKVDEPEEAVEYFEELLTLYKKLAAKDPDTYSPQLIRCFHELGSLAEKARNLNRAILMYEEEIKLYPNYIGKDPEMTESRYANRLGYAGYLMVENKQLDAGLRRNDEAAKIYQKLAITEPNRFDTLLANTYSYSATIAKQNNQLEKAAGYCEEALKVGDRMSTENRVRFTFNFLRYAYQNGRLYEELNNGSKAAISYKKAVAYAKVLYQTDISHLKTVSDMYSPLFDVYKEMKEKDSLLKYCNEYISFVRRHLTTPNIKPNAFTMAHAMSEAGSAYSYLCIPDSTQFYYKSALSFVGQYIREAGNPVSAASKEKLVTFIGNASWYAVLAKEFEQAAQYATKGLEMENDAAWIKTNLAHAMLLQGRYADAEKLYTELIAAPAQNGGGTKRKNIILDDFLTLECAGVVQSSLKADIIKIRSLVR